MRLRLARPKSWCGSIGNCRNQKHEATSGGLVAEQTGFEPKHALYMHRFDRAVWRRCCASDPWRATSSVRSNLDFGSDRYSSNRCGLCDSRRWVRELGPVAQNFALPHVVQAEPDLVRLPKRQRCNRVVVGLRERIDQRQRVCGGLRRARGGRGTKAASPMSATLSRRPFEAPRDRQPPARTARGLPPRARRLAAGAIRRPTAARSRPRARQGPAARTTRAGGRPEQRSRVALLGVRSRLAGRRADRPPYLGIVPTESFLMSVTDVETVRDSAKASTRADLVQTLIEFALQSDMEPNPAVQQKRVAARQMRDPFFCPKAARLQLSRPCWKRSSHWQVMAARSAVHCLPRCKACHSL